MLLRICEDEVTVVVKPCQLEVPEETFGVAPMETQVPAPMYVDRTSEFQDMVRQMQAAPPQDYNQDLERRAQKAKMIRQGRFHKQKGWSAPEWKSHFGQWNANSWAIQSAMSHGGKWSVRSWKKYHARWSANAWANWAHEFYDEDL